MKFTNISRYQLPLAQVLLCAALLLRMRGVGHRCRCYEALPQSVYKRCHGVLWRVPSFQHTVGTLLTLRFVLKRTQGFTAALGSPVQRQERRCLWGAPQLLSALSLLSERTLGCRGVFQACHTHCEHTVEPSVHLWRDVGLHCGPQKPGSEASAAVFVGYFLSTFGPLLGL